MSSHQFAFEKLDVWKEARKLVKNIYISTKSFPKSEQFGITNQIRRAAVSVPSNIAEGVSRTTGKDQAHFTSIAFGSLMELTNQLMISVDLGFLSN